MRVFGWLKSILKRTPVPPAAFHVLPDKASVTAEESSDGPVWCVAANVLMERGHGPGGREKRRGTKHFAPGAKVFIYEFFGGCVTVIGRHRKSRRFIRLTMPAKHLANWRAELVYSPYVIKQVGRPPHYENARLRAEEIAASYIKQGAGSQPFATRPPAAD